MRANDVTRMLFLTAAWTAAAIAAEPTRLTAEYRTDPIGLEARNPRLSWRMAAEPDARDERQTAYQIQAATAPERLKAGQPDLWDSGEVRSDASLNIRYAGQPLTSSQRVFWRVRTWNRDGKPSDWSAPATWVMGILEPGDWKAKWIGPNAITRPDADLGGARWIRTADQTYRKTFTLDALPKGAVEMAFTARDSYLIHLNGKEVTRPHGHLYRWQWMRFMDVAAYLKAGKNELVVKLKPEKQETSGLLLALRFPDGKRIVTDASWEKAEVLGGPREVPWGKELVLRQEIASPAFEKAFTLSKPVARATLHITGLGFYEATLNGRRIGEKVLDPSPTAYDHTVLYSTYLLDGALRTGENTLRVLVGHGWYDVRSYATWNFDVAPWRDFPRMIAQLEVTYADGSREAIVSDETWRQVRSPIGFDCIREGEVIGTADPRIPDLESRVVHAEAVPAPKGKLTAEAQPGAKIQETVAPRRIDKVGDGSWLIEFPVNMAGWIRMRFHGQQKGDVVTIRYDERANADHTPAQAGNYRVQSVNKDKQEVRAIDCHFHATASHNLLAEGAAFQADRYVCSGTDGEVYEPRFTYNGFQYVWVTGLREAPTLETVTARVIHTDFGRIGTFTCSDPTFNQLMAMADRAYRSNFADGVPTDCPHREKNGWTGDASTASELAQYLYENTAGYEKWLRDIRDAQLPDGNIPGIVPTSGWGFAWGNGPAWDSALTVIPLTLWAYRDDRAILDELYPVIKRYVDYTATRCPDGIAHHGLGDWIPVKSTTPVELTSTAFFRQAAHVCARIAALNGLTGDAAKYQALAEKAKAAANRLFYKGNGLYDKGQQTAQAFALAFDLVPEGDRPAAQARLIEAVEKANRHVDVGLLGMKHIFRTVSQAGRTDLAFQMLTQPTAPSPAEWVKKGGTALWEDWGDGSSRNHIMFGDFCAWAYQYLAGIRLPEAADCVAIPEPEIRAFRKVVIAPDVIEALTSVSATVDGPYGPITSTWNRSGKHVTLTVTIPANCTAEVRLPAPDREGKRIHTVGSGTYTFACDR